ncbi:MULTISPECIES: porin [Paraburkholderia]|jgi:predicted porin|uniref:Porin n=1 Tax=Paraburkholderia largidicola TaxID=3014751 RepID=A0A7I8BKX7_9BURK|nr:MULTISPECIES: porin [Paraburkholderia]BEU22243.1 porin [Paraburkholderia sp. 22B1P]GJH36703.1 porin [Paraburkholderia hospita]CAG9253297.1 Outer membrane protein (porin) [Paraburkholderia caribensis]BCF89292.1 porin [Paraburkholderia sp. PGU16]GJH03832.1 porin [Paraburkholderia terrae]
MKKALAAAALLTFGVAAHAQSSVTLYGRLDAGLEYMSGVPSNQVNGSATNSTHRFRAESGDWGTSLWGLKGAEDLGGGYKAVFQLEGSFNTMTGAGPGGGGLFNRWATVGFASDQYGTFTMGRMLFISNGVWDFDPFGQSNWSSASLVRGRNWPQSSNNVAYQSPKIAGFDFYGQYALSNATNWNGNGTTPQGREAGAQVTYTSSLFQIRGLYDEIRNPANGGLFGPAGDATNTGNIGTGVFAASREYSALVNVFLGQFKIQAAYQAVRTSGATAVLPGTPTTLDHEWGGVTWQATPAAALIAAVYHVNGNNGAGNATIYTVGGSYNLSKRTLLDLQVATVQNSKGANYGLNANNSGTAVATDNPLPGHSQTGVYAGIQHSF